MVQHWCVDGLPFADIIGYSIMVVLSFVLLFVALYYMVKLLRTLVVARTETILHNVIGQNGLVAIFAGLVFTVFVQSSSITTSLLVPLVGAGICTVEMVFPITMGANIGTTTTSILAALATGSPAAITIAFVHFLFNVLGVCLLYPIPLLRKIPIAAAKWLGELAYVKRRYAVLYVLTVFFFIPIAIIIFSRFAS